MDPCRCARRPAEARGRKAGHERDPDHPSVPRGHDNGRCRGAARRPPCDALFLNVDEAAGLLRTTRRAIYAMVERRQLPCVVRLRRRVLFRSDVLLDWLDQKCAPSPKE